MIPQGFSFIGLTNVYAIPLYERTGCGLSRYRVLTLRGDRYIATPFITRSRVSAEREGARLIREGHSVILALVPFIVRARS